MTQEQALSIIDFIDQLIDAKIKLAKHDLDYESRSLYLKDEQRAYRGLREALENETV